MTENKAMSETGTWRPANRPRATGIKGALETLWFRFSWLLVHGETTAVRFLLALVAALWSIMLALPGDTLERPVYTNLALLAPEWVWCVVWGAYSVAKFWRIFCTTAPAWATFSINGIGLLLYASSGVCIAFADVWPQPAGQSGEMVLTLAAVWIFSRSGLNHGPDWRND